MDTFNYDAFYSALFSYSFNEVKTKYYSSRHCGFCAVDYSFSNDYSSSVSLSVVFYEDYFHFALYKDFCCVLNQKLSYNDYFLFNHTISRAIMEVDNG